MIEIALISLNANISPTNLYFLLNLYSFSLNVEAMIIAQAKRVPERVSVPFSACSSSKQPELLVQLEFLGEDREAVNTEMTGM